MLKRRIESFIEKITQPDTYDPRNDPDASGWYFPGHLPGQQEAIPQLIPDGEYSYPDSDVMVQMIEEGIAETNRELAAASQELGSVALNDTIQPPDSLEV
ncbi:MAG: hypothetical protein WAZ21_03555 [Candidatus Saccharimonadales bacterium]